jgi:SWI/SNF-related matrix-associated actin-dependent regulator of chromatin subfamily B protein 1
MFERYRTRDNFFQAHNELETTKREELIAERRELNVDQGKFQPPQHPQDRQARAWKARDVYGEGFAGYGNGWTTTMDPQVIYPYDHQRKKWPGHKTRHDHRMRRFNRKEMAEQSDKLEDLVPVRLDIEHDKIKLRDTFTWNLHDRLIDRQIFAETLVEDFKVPPEHFGLVVNEVSKTIFETVQEYYPHVFMEDQPEEQQPAPGAADKNDDMRIVIKLSITIGSVALVDQFEWDINNPENSPEEFARQLTKDMALSGEFTTAIAHQIREQVQIFTKSLYITGHPFDGRPIEDSDVRDNFLPSPPNATFRPVQSAKDYIPMVWDMSPDELNAQEVSILRDQRRQKRSVTRRGGPALPDLKERDRTVRTLVVSSVLPGASETIENARLFKHSRASGRGRRANRLDGSDSEEEESEESETEEVTQITGGTARTRGMRGAATAAQAAIRGTLGRSQTPELAQLETPHHDRRATSRSLRYEMREESVPEPTSLIVKLKINPTKFRAWLRTHAAGSSKANSTPQVNSRTATPQHLNQGPAGMPPPPSPAPASKNTPRPSSRGTPANESTWRYHADGSVDAPDPLPEDESQFVSLPLDLPPNTRGKD